MEHQKFYPYVSLMDLHSFNIFCGHINGVLLCVEGPF
jgi:hypothetical protein